MTRNSKKRTQHRLALLPLLVALGQRPELGGHHLVQARRRAELRDGGRVDGHRRRDTVIRGLVDMLLLLRWWYMVMVVVGVGLAEISVVVQRMVGVARI